MIDLHGDTLPLWLWVGLRGSKTEETNRLLSVRSELPGVETLQRYEVAQTAAEHSWEVQLATLAGLKAVVQSSLGGAVEVWPASVGRMTLLVALGMDSAAPAACTGWVRLVVEGVERREAVRGCCPQQAHICLTEQRLRPMAVAGRATPRGARAVELGLAMMNQLEEQKVARQMAVRKHWQPMTMVVVVAVVGQ